MLSFSEGIISLSLLEGSFSLFKIRMSFIDGVITGVRLTTFALAGFLATLGMSLMQISNFLTSFSSMVSFLTCGN
jgi:hypothetical protein